MYIGKTGKERTDRGRTKEFNSNLRWLEHVRDARLHVNNGCVALNNAIRLYGAENFTVEVIDECNGSDEANDLETMYIALYNTLTPNGYNIKKGGSGDRHTDESRAKISASKVGKKHTEETKKKLSDMSKDGKHHLAGAKFSDNAKDNMSQGKRVFSEDLPRYMHKLNPDTNGGKVGYRVSIPNHMIRTFVSGKNTDKENYDLAKKYYDEIIKKVSKVEKTIIKPKEEKQNEEKLVDAIPDISIAENRETSDKIAITEDISTNRKSINTISDIPIAKSKQISGKNILSDNISKNSKSSRKPYLDMYGEEITDPYTIEMLDYMLNLKETSSTTKC